MDPKQLSREIIAEILEELRQLANDPQYMEEALADMGNLMLAKGEDYSGADHQFTNFELNAKTTGLAVDQVFLALAGVKFSRLANLLKPRPYVDDRDPGDNNFMVKFARPNFESIEDSWIDFANYIVLPIGYKRFKRRFGADGNGNDLSNTDVIEIRDGQISPDTLPPTF